MKYLIFSIIAAVCCTVTANANGADVAGMNSRIIAGELKSDANILPKPDSSLPLDEYKQAAIQYVNNYISLIGIYNNSISNKAIEHNDFSTSTMDTTTELLNLLLGKINNADDESRRTLIGDCMDIADDIFTLATEKLIACSGVEALIQNAVEEGMDYKSLTTSCKDELDRLVGCTTGVSTCEQAALAKLNEVISAFKTQKAKAELLGSLGAEQNGPAVKVTKGDKEVMLYAPDKVDYIIIKK